MDTAHYLRTITRQWWLILILVIAGGLGGFLVFSATTPLYQSSIQLIVTGAAADRDMVLERAVAMGQIAGTPPALTDAQRTAGYAGATPTVTATATGRDPFITIVVVDSSPVAAQAIANAFPVSLPNTLLQLEGQSAAPVNIAVVSPAQLAGEPFTPILYRDVGLGVLAGLILGVAVALLRDALNRTVRDGEELESLTGLTILGAVPRKSTKQLLPVTTEPRSLRAEAYRQIRSSLTNSSLGRKQLIAVTSAAPGEGKTSVTTNVAAAFCRAGHRVAIVDADLRRPRVAEYFGVKSERGLTDVLAGECDLDDALTIVDDGRMALLTSGRIPANPSEALGGVLMEKVLAQLAAEYEFVFIDTPPVLPVADALVLAPKVDAMILVVKMGTTTRERVKLAMASLLRANTIMIGVVPNQVGRGSDTYYGNRYSYAESPKHGKAGSDEVTIPANVLRSPAGGSSFPAAGEVPDPIAASGAATAVDGEGVGEPLDSAGPTRERVDTEAESTTTPDDQDAVGENIPGDPESAAPKLYLPPPPHRPGGATLVG